MSTPLYVALALWVSIFWALKCLTAMLAGNIIWLLIMFVGAFYLGVRL